MTMFVNALLNEIGSLEEFKSSRWRLSRLPPATPEELHRDIILKVKILENVFLHQRKISQRIKTWAEVVSNKESIPWIIFLEWRAKISSKNFTSVRLDIPMWEIKDTHLIWAFQTYSLYYHVNDGSKTSTSCDI